MPTSVAPLVGRSAELTELTGALERARGGAAAAVVVSGDAGVGKTRLLTELLAVAVAGNTRTLLGHCLDLGDMPPPYLPFTEAFTRVAVEEPAEMTRLVAAFPALARLLPAHLGLDAAAPAGSRDERVDRGELFDSVLGGLGALGAVRPVLLVVEDVHWADQATRDLVGYLVARLDGERVAVVVTYRSDDLHRRHPLRRTLAEWARLPGLRRLHLAPLGADDVRTLLHSENVTGLSAAELDDIVSRAEGNAFFAEELLSAVGQFGADELPWQLADLLLVRLDRLSDDARQVVRVAAVGGRRVPYDMLEQAIELSGPRLDAALREALDSNILQLTSSGRGYVFRHALLAEAVYDDLLPGERVRIHARYAGLLAQDAGRSPSELARHAYASHDYPTAFDASVSAGRAAMALAAPQEALQHFENALELVDQLAPTTPGPVDLTLLAVDAAEAAGRYLRGLDLARAAFTALPADAGDLDRARLLAAEVRLAMSGEIDEQALSVATQALELAPRDPPTAFLAQLMALHARVAASLGHEVDAQRTAEQALDTAGRVASPAAAADAAATLAALKRRTGDPEDAARRLEAAIEQARLAGDVGVELRTWYSLGGLAHEQCRLDRALEVFTAGHRRSVEAGRPWDIFGVHSRAMTATVQWVQGDWDAALATLDTAGERPTGLSAAIFRATSIAVRAGRGEHSVVAERALLEPYWLREGRIALYYAFGALAVHEQQADSASALALVDEVSGTLSRLWLNEWFLGRIQLSAMALAAVCADAAAAPSARHAGLAAHGAQLLATGLRSAERGLPKGRELGREGRAWLAQLQAEEARLRWLTGHRPPGADELVALWRATVDEFDFGHVLQLTVARTRLVEALQAAGQTVEAVEVAASARADALRTGAAPMLALLGAGGDRATGGRGLAALTERERGVLAELVDGRTNRQIAAKLFISEKTASVHVSNILAKLGVHSRAEAAALARRVPGG